MARRAGTVAMLAMLAALVGTSPLRPATRPAATTTYPLPTGRSVSPAGTLTTLRSYPTGVAVAPDGHTVMTIAGSFSTGGAADTSAPGAGTQLYVVDAATGLMTQMLNVGDAFQSLLFDKAGARVFVAGASSKAVHILTANAAGQWGLGSDLAATGYVSGIALSADESTVWAAEPADNRVVRIDVASGQVTATVTVPAPDQLVLSADGSRVLASNWRARTVTAIATTSLATSTIAVGDHPSAMARTPSGQVVVAGTNDATLATIAPGASTAVLTRLSQLVAATDSPNAIVAAPDGRLLVSLGADDAVAVLSPTGIASAPWTLSGLIPTAWYPNAVALDPGGAQLEIVSARGLAHGIASTAPYATPDPNALVADGAYETAGTLQSLALPGTAALAADTATVRSLLARPVLEAANPVALGPRGPIKHVIYVTRENKTYDSNLGDLHPGPENALVVYGQQVTPNLHALERSFVESQSFYYPAYASQTGHFFEDAGTDSDIHDRSNGVGTLQDSWHDPTNYPAGGLLTEQAWHAGLSVRTYNEELAQQSQLLPARNQAPTSVFKDYDLAISDASREAGWETEFAQFERHHCTGILAATYGSSCSLPALEYVYLGEDHTTVTLKPGYPSTQAQVADNDYATGKLVDLVSHSPDWASTLVVIVEDDPQSTGDIVSDYRGFLALAGPYVKRGHISTVPYNLTGIVGAIDRILGLPPLSDYAATSRPLDDLFTAAPDCAPYTVDSSGIALFPFTPIPGAAAPANGSSGIYSYTEPDRIDPVVAARALHEEVLRTHPLGSFANPATQVAANRAAALQTHDALACPGLALPGAAGPGAGGQSGGAPGLTNTAAAAGPGAGGAAVAILVLGVVRRVRRGR